MLFAIKPLYRKVGENVLMISTLEGSLFLPLRLASIPKIKHTYKYRKKRKKRNQMKELDKKRKKVHKFKLNSPKCSHQTLWESL